MFEVNVFNNGDHACVAWRPEGADPANWTPLPGCRGFAIERQLTRDGKQGRAWLRNRVGFTSDQPAPPPDQAWQWPLQRYLWWDYGVRPGDTVSYRVFPVFGPADALSAPDNGGHAEWSPPQIIGSDFGDGIKAWFNRGIIATQWVARALKERDATGSPRSTLLHAVETVGDPLRDRLGGLLKSALLTLLRTAPGDVYAALYELNDPEVKDALTTLGARCHLILGNGAFRPGETDENADVREELKTNTDIDLLDRIVVSPHFAHNKFFLFCDAQGRPATVFTGSTNLTVTGLCTQANNGILIDDANVAQDYMAAWQRLRAAGSGYPAALVDGNSTATQHVVGHAKITSWFAATRGSEDMKAARTLIEEAKNGILFLFFFPGNYAEQADRATLLQSIVARQNEPDLYVRGVVNRSIDRLTNVAPTAPVSLVRGTEAPLDLPKSVLVPEAIEKDYANWEAELQGASGVMIHSKVVVLDPFGAKPIVMTGSHNLGFKASQSNDDNLNIIEGNASLARAYAANIVAIYQEYRWRDYVAKHQTNAAAWKGLEDNDAWQQGHLTREASELLFWVPPPTP